MTNVTFNSNPSNAYIRKIGSVTPHPTYTPTPTLMPTISPICSQLISSYSIVIKEYDTNDDGKISYEEERVAYNHYMGNHLKPEDYFAVRDFYRNNCTLPYIPTPTPLPKANLDEFRNECMSNESVKVSWSTIKKWMIDRRVASIWWDFTQKERKSIAEIAVKNTLFYYVDRVKDGNNNCSGATGDEYISVCIHNSIIRTQHFGTPVNFSKKCYYKSNTGSYKCYYISQYYGLPTHDIELRTGHVTGEGSYGHAICGIQINKNINDYRSWVLFQYWDWDIKLGDKQFPLNKVDLYFRVFTIRSIEHVRKFYAFKVVDIQVY